MNTVSAYDPINTMGISSQLGDVTSVDRFCTNALMSGAKPLGFDPNF